MSDNAWETLEQGARWALEHARELPPISHVQGMGSLLRLWSYPAGKSYCSWTILVPIESDQKRPMVREVFWNRPKDERQLVAIERKHKVRTKQHPTIHTRDADLTLRDLNPFLEAAARLSVPAIPVPEGVSPGTLSGIEGYSSLAYLRIEWRESGPAEWTDAILWMDRLRDFLMASLKERETAGG